MAHLYLTLSQSSRPEDASVWANVSDSAEHRIDSEEVSDTDYLGNDSRISTFI